MTDPVLHDIVAMLRANELSLSDDPENARQLFEAMFAEVPMHEGVDIKQAEVGGIPGLWLVPHGAPENRVVLYLHGGGYVVGSANAYKTIAGGLAAASGVRVFIPDYRLAPEHPYPAGPDDVLSCYRSLLSTGPQVVVVGDSAGGGLVMTLLISARQAGLAQPACAILWSPWIDLSCSLPSITDNAANDPTLDREGLASCAGRYLGDNAADDAALNPLQTDLSELASLLIQVGSIEILLDDAVCLARQAAIQGTYCELEIWPDMPHVFQGFAPALEPANRALASCVSFMERHASGEAS